MKYTFISNSATQVMVEAGEEFLARHRAMVELYGEPRGLRNPVPGEKGCLIIGGPLYLGQGLILVKTEQ